MAAFHHRLLAAALAAAGALVPAPAALASGHALRFFGTGTGQADRVKISLADVPRLNVGGDFTIEFWMKADRADNAGTVAAGRDGDGWITGNVVIDRDVYGPGDRGDYGIALGRRGAKTVVAFGVHNGTAGNTLVGARHVGDNRWHHVAAVRTAAGRLQLVVDGVADAAGAGPPGDISYRIGRPTAFPGSDPFLVFGAEKHDAGAAYPSYNGFLDEVRIWARALGTAEIARIRGRILDPAGQTGLAAYWRFEEGAGRRLRDAVHGAAGTLFPVRADNGHWADGAPVRAAGDAYEPDASRSAARRIANGRTQRRSIHAAGDTDWAVFRIGSAGARNVRIETSGTSGDTQLWLYRGSRLIAYNDNGGAGRFSRITRSSLPAGTYYIKVREYGNNAAIPRYRLAASWSAP